MITRNAEVGTRNRGASADGVSDLSLLFRVPRSDFRVRQEAGEP